MQCNPTMTPSMTIKPFLKMISIVTNPLNYAAATIFRRNGKILSINDYEI